MKNKKNVKSIKMMKNKKIILLVVVWFILILSLSSSVLGWKNAPTDTSTDKRMCAKYATKQGTQPQNIVKFFITHYNMPTDPTNGHFYGPHDFLAQFAIEYLEKSTISGKYSWLADKNRKYFYTYLLATEYPDYPSNIKLNFYSPKIILDCGKSTGVNRGFGDGSHKLDRLKILANKRGGEARNWLKRTKDVDGDKIPDPWCQTGAFYLGAMTHYITEVAHPLHATSIIYDNFHQWLENQVGYLTKLEHYKTNLYGNNFFTIDLEKILGYNASDLRDLSGFDAVNQMALVTEKNTENFFDGREGTGKYNVTYFIDFYKNHGYGFSFSEVGRNNEEYKPFFDRVEQLLNWAVFFTACSLRHYLKDFDGVVTECTEGDDDNPQNSRDRNLPPYPEVLDFISRYGLFFTALAFAGILGRKFFASKFR